MITELYVKLLIPDTTAITAFQTLKRMGYETLKSLTRSDYYRFESEEDIKEKITTCDILVNVNKHKPFTELK